MARIQPDICIYGCKLTFFRYEGYLWTLALRSFDPKSQPNPLAHNVQGFSMSSKSCIYLPTLL